MKHSERLINSFMELVRIDSETKYEAEIAAFLTKRLNELGFHVECDEMGPTIGHQAGNLFASLDATADYENKPTLLFTCHMDTVTPGKGIQPRLDEDGYIRGDGTTILGSDDKAGIASFIEAIIRLKEKKIAHGKIIFVITIAEESGLLGSALLTPDSIQADYGFALDSNGKVGEINLAAPTTAKLAIEIHGRKAHAGVNPEDGISAIQVAGVALANMPLGRIDDITTANIGRIEGGEQTNIVCDFVKMTAEARSLDNNQRDAQVDKMKRALKQAAAQYNAHVDIDVNVIYPAFELEPTSDVVQLATRAIKTIGRIPTYVKSGGGSDANHFNRIGIPTVNLAIGYENIHTTQEQMPVTELIKTAQLVEAIIMLNANESE